MTADYLFVRLALRRAKVALAYTVIIILSCNYEVFRIFKRFCQFLLRHPGSLKFIAVFLNKNGFTGVSLGECPYRATQTRLC